MLSGSEVSLFPVTFKILRLSNSPIESGRDLRRFEDKSSSSSFSSPEIVSGKNCKKKKDLVTTRDDTNKMTPIKISSSDYQSLKEEDSQTSKLLKTAIGSPKS